MKNHKIISFIFCVVFVSTLLYSCKENKKFIMDTDHVIPWCIVAFDSVNRTPKERIDLLNELGFKKYAYDWRDHHLDDMSRELELAKESEIDVVSVWLWLNAKRDSLDKLSPSNQRIFEIMKESKLETDLWLSFSNNFFEDLSHEECLEKATELVAYVCRQAAEINCQVALYNHTGWFGDPANQVEIIKNLPQFEVKIIYNFHHGHEHIDYFDEVVETILPYVKVINLNGMKKGGPKILSIGQGDYEKDMIRTLLDKGYQGPWGILGHVENADVKNVLIENMDGLNKLN